MTQANSYSVRPGMARPPATTSGGLAMPCSRQQAVIRLITLWAIRSEADDAFSYRVGLGDILADNVVDLVAAGDLFADLDAPAEQPAPFDRETERRHQLLEAWIAPRGKAVQQ